MSATICAKTVSCPCPWLCAPVMTLMLPVAFTRTVAASIKAHPRAEHAHKVRRRDPAGLDPGRQPQAAQLAACLATLPPALLEPGEVADLDQLVQRRLIVAGVIDQADRRGVGELVGRDEVLPPHLDRIEPQLAAHLVHDPLDARTSPRAGPHRDRRRPARCW